MADVVIVCTKWPRAMHEHVREVAVSLNTSVSELTRQAILREYPIPEKTK